MSTECLWKTTGGGNAWPDAEEMLHRSDAILELECNALTCRMGDQNMVATCPQWYDRMEDKDFKTEGSLITQRRAGCGDASARRNAGGNPGGWLMPVCPLNTYSNNVVRTENSVCAPRHQAFMNQTRRGTGTHKDSARTRPGF